jgi:signal peptidase II
MTRYFPKPAFFGLFIAIAALAFDQLHKWWMLEIVSIGTQDAIAVAPFFNLVLVWNRGVSFGLFAGHNQPYLLVAIALVLVAVLSVWLRKITVPAEAAAIGLVIGGALGNVIDRLRFGAVADFFDLHAAGYHWPAFNIADSCIFIGVVVLCARSMFTGSKSA